MKSRASSPFFSRGFYKKPRACPYHFINGEWSIKESIDGCDIPVSRDSPVIVEQKFNGNRGIFEFDGERGCLSSARKECHEKGFPSKVNDLLSSYLRSTGTRDAVLDGEMYLESCNGNVPGINKQARAIKGKHDDMERDCAFSYKVYDIIKLDGHDASRLSQLKRKELLASILPEKIASGNVSVEPVQGMVVSSIDDVIKIAADVISRGGEGIVVKSVKDRYTWSGRDEKHPSIEGWWKVKNASVIDAEATVACLGKPGKTGLNAFRYVSFQLGACKDSSCNDLVSITEKGVSHSTPGGDASGHEKWNEMLHDKVVSMIKSGEARSISPFRDVESIKKTGLNPGSFVHLVQGYKDSNGAPGLPRCVVLPRKSLILTVAGLEFNLDKHGIPKINGPPRVVLVNKATRAWTVDEILALPSVHS